MVLRVSVAVTGLVLSLVAKIRVQNGAGDGNGMANAGIVCSCVTLGLYAVGIGFFVVMMAAHRYRRVVMISQAQSRGVPPRGALY